MAIIYQKAHNDAAYGKLDTPIKMIIEHESDLLTKKGGLADWLFNIEKSSRFGETIINNNEFDTFQAAAEGASAAQDDMFESSKKFIEHIQFMKEFIITQTMMEDSVTGVAADPKLRAQNFVRAYYKTMHKLASQCLANGNATSFSFNGHTVDTTTGDSKALFATDHVWGKTISGSSKTAGTQSNKFCGSFLSGTPAMSAEEVLFEAAVKLRNMKDENGEALGYTADTIVLPGNHPKLEKLVKAACGSESMTGGDFNDINLQYGNWSIIVDPFWILGSSAPAEFRVMSSEANKALRGNMLFNRVPLTVRSFIDDHTWNNCWSGRCRFGAGFGTYKHILTIADIASSGAEAAGYTAL